MDNHVVVRIKRKLGDEPVDNLLIVEDTRVAKKRTLKALSLGDDSDIKPKYLKLTRVETVQDANSATSVINSNRTAPQSNFSGTNVQKQHKIVVTGTKLVTENLSSPIVVIDMQQYWKSNDRQNSASTEKKPTRILDPATRMLESGILEAFGRGNFNSLSAALMQGANANHQTIGATTLRSSASDNATTRKPVSVSGITSLMAAALHCNVRVVKRLLTKGVSVGLCNSAGLSAIDLLTFTNRNAQDAIEIQFLLQQALTKEQQEKAFTATTSATPIVDEWTDSDGTAFVYDVFHVQSNHTDGEGSDVASSAEAMHVADDGHFATAVRVDGLRIHDDGIGADLLVYNEAAYDSDWSDLGDDEDPDSNDERFHGNDYPEEEEEEEIDEEDEERATGPHQKTAGAGRVSTGAHRWRHTNGDDNNSEDEDERAMNDDSSEDESNRPRRMLRPAAAGTNNKASASQGRKPVAAARSNLPFKRAPYQLSARGGKDGEEEEQQLYNQLNSAADFIENYPGMEEEEEGDEDCYDGGCETYEDEGYQQQEENSDYDLNAEDEAEAAAVEEERNVKRAQRKKATGSGAKKGVTFETLLDDDDEALPGFDGRHFGIGKVIRPSVLQDDGDGGAKAGNQYSSHLIAAGTHDSQSLQALWGMEDDVILTPEQELAGGMGPRGGTQTGRAGQSKDGGTAAHAQRVQDMRARTGMAFGSNLREFDLQTGLVKYGGDLSDDDEAVMDSYVHYDASLSAAMNKQGGSVPHNSVRHFGLPKETVAYDSELDNSD